MVAGQDNCDRWEKKVDEDINGKRGVKCLQFLKQLFWEKWKKKAKTIVFKIYMFGYSLSPVQTDVSIHFKIKTKLKSY